MNRSPQEEIDFLIVDEQVLLQEDVISGAMPHGTGKAFYSWFSKETGDFKTHLRPHLASLKLSSRG